MRIAVVSDTHSRHETVKAALRQIEGLGAELILHCGDIEDADTVYLFPPHTHFVFGNCDDDRAGLKQAMALGAGRDRIARQYVSAYADIFEIGVPRYREATAGGLAPEEAAAAVHLRFMASFADSHVQRKYGAATAEAVRGEADLLDREWLWRGPWVERRRRLLAFDSKLKSRNLNPGISADLTVACLLAHRLDDMIRLPPRSGPERARVRG